MTPNYNNVTRAKVMIFASTKETKRLWQAENTILQHIYNFEAGIKDWKSEIEMVESSYEPSDAMDAADKVLLRNSRKTLKQLERDRKKATMSLKIIQAELQRRAQA